METIDIEVIKRADRDHGHYFFEPATMRFFDSRAPQTALKVGDKAYFITSERYHASEGPPRPRRYTIRVCDLKTGNCGTLDQDHGFQKYGSSEAAMDDLRHILKELEAEACKEPGPK